jgi:hypothetical protein
MSDILTQLTQKVKNFINSIRIPSLLSFFISKEGQINPTIEEALKTAGLPKTNWERLGLDKEVFGVPRWAVITLPIVMIAVRYSSDTLKFAVEIVARFVIIVAGTFNPLSAVGINAVTEAVQFFISLLAQGSMLILLAWLGYKILKSFKK